MTKTDTWVTLPSSLDACPDWYAIGKLEWVEYQSLKADALGYTNPNFEVLGVTPQAVLDVFTFGFGSIFFFWFLGFLVGVAITAIKKT